MPEPSLVADVISTSTGSFGFYCTAKFDDVTRVIKNFKTVAKFKHLDNGYQQLIFQ